MIGTMAARLLGLTLALLSAAALAQPTAERVDTALVLAVDVSGSIDARRFVLQMEGIAAAFEDPVAQNAMLAGRHGAMLVTLIGWSNKPHVALPWTVIASADDARYVAGRVRLVPRGDDQFTCMSAMMRLVADNVLPLMPMPADRTIVDVSGDGADNCNPTIPVDAVRDELVADGVTINGLPILEGPKAPTLETWYRDHVIGGDLAFLIPAMGFEDFGRAIRRKFVIEISAREGYSLASGHGTAEP